MSNNNDTETISNAMLQGAQCAFFQQVLRPVFDCHVTCSPPFSISSQLIQHKKYLMMHKSKSQKPKTKNQE